MWKPKTTFKSDNKGFCPHCGHEFSLTDIVPPGKELSIITENEPKSEKLEPDLYCPSCDTGLEFDLALKLEVLTSVFKNSS